MFSTTTFAVLVGVAAIANGNLVAAAAGITGIAAAALVYRAISTWLVLLIGWVVLAASAPRSQRIGPRLDRDPARSALGR